jgi:hypothetical protein
MQQKILRTIALRSFALVVALGAACQSQAQDTKTPYPSMAPLDQYLIVDRNVEITLARSAAPESISRDAEIMVLGRHGYETAVKGKNGFVYCLALVGSRNRRSGLLESQAALSGLLEPARRAIQRPTYPQENRTYIGGAI